MKKIYIILTHTGTALSKLIKGYTKDEFSHVSIALDIELKEMYSFGRLNPNNPFWGGFVHEYIDKGTFKRFYKTRAKVYSLEVTEEQYKSIKSNIDQIKNNKEDYKFNIIGLFAAGFHKKIEKEKSFYCAVFVKYVMENGAGISMNRSSSSQSTQGTPVSASQMQPGDLIFYGNGSRINHVAPYIGNGQIVHASTYKTGIKISNWNYRTPVKITSVFPR